MKLNNDTLIFKGSTPWNGKVFRGTTLIWPTEPPRDYSSEYFTLELTESGTTGVLEMSFLSWSSSFSNLIKEGLVYFSINEGEWKVFSSSTREERTISYGDTMRLKGGSAEYYNYAHAAINLGENPFKAYGNLLSLQYGDNFSGVTSFRGNVNGQFYELFRNTSIADAENLVLPAFTLYGEDYGRMFYSCSGLTKAPKVLPATGLAESSYEAMFKGTAISRSPKIAATNVFVEKDIQNNIIGSCDYMFSGCTNLELIDCELYGGRDAEINFFLWTAGVSPTGTFIKHPNAVWARGVPIGTGSEHGIPSGWTVQDAVL